MTKARKMLNDLQAPYIQSLMRLIESQSKDTLANWAITYAERVLLPLWKAQHPADLRPQEALSAARSWLAGSIKLPQAKAAILACHASARAAEGQPVAQAAARAIGQCASTIHSARHCIGLAFYGALAVAYDQLRTDAPWAQIEEAASAECGRMQADLQAMAATDEPLPAKE